MTQTRRTTPRLVQCIIWTLAASAAFPAAAQVTQAVPQVRPASPEEITRIAEIRFPGTEARSRQPLGQICGCEHPRLLERTVRRREAVRSGPAGSSRVELPQVRAEIAQTNRVKSRREAEMERRAEPTPEPAGRASADAQAQARHERIRELLDGVQSAPTRERIERVREAVSEASSESQSPRGAESARGTISVSTSESRSSAGGDGVETAAQAASAVLPVDPCVARRAAPQPATGLREFPRPDPASLLKEVLIERAPRRSLDGIGLMMGPDAALVDESMLPSLQAWYQEQHRAVPWRFQSEAADPLDIAADLLARGDLPAAAAACVQQVNRTDGSDAEAIRLLGVVLLQDGATDDGVRVLVEAYRADPSLAEHPLDPAVLPQGALSLKSILNRVVREAQGGNPDGWLAAAILNQWQGRDEVASLMLARAALGGADESVRESLSAALAQRR